MVKDQSTCLVSGKTGHQAPPPLQPLTWLSQPWKHLQLDICSEIHVVPHHQHFLVVTYYLHSKWPELTTTGWVISQVILDLLNSLFSCWGLPKIINTKKGPPLVSAEFSTYHAIKGICHVHTALYHLQGNSGIEHVHQSLTNGIRVHLAQGCSFKQAICLNLLHYRATQHSTTGVSPASLVLGWEFHLPLDRLCPFSTWVPSPIVKASVNHHY